MILYFNQVLMLKTNSPKDSEQLMQKPYFKIHLKRYVDKIESHSILFKADLTITRIQKIKEMLEKRLSEVEIDISVVNQIQKRTYYIDSRRRVGNDIKKRNSSIKVYFEEFSEVVQNKMSRPLTDEQMWNGFYMYVMKKVSNFSVPGSGKTATVLGTYCYMKYMKEVSRIVMIGPKSAFGSWIDEYKICFGIDNEDFVLNIHGEEITSATKRKYALRLESGNKELVLINYESVESLKEEIKSLVDKHTLLVLDEVHKIKNPKGKRANAVLEVSKDASSIIALTGTPIPNSYEDVHNLLNLLYPDDYEDFFGFDTGMLRAPSAKDVEDINYKMKPFFCRISKDELGVPRANEDFLVKTNVSLAEEELFKILFQKYRNNLFALFIRILQLESNPRELLNSLDLAELKYVVDDESDFGIDVEVVDYSEEALRLIESIDESTKVGKTISLIQDLVSEDKTIIVWCNLISSMKLLERKCKQSGIKVKLIYGEVRLEDRVTLINDFKKGMFDVLITNPHTLAESVSLHTACHDAIYFEYSYNLVHLLQSKDRIHRLGLEKDQYTQYYFIQNYYNYNNEYVSFAEKVYDRLKEKEEIMNNAIENDILEQQVSSEEDLKLIFSGF